jgi:hypothetical protein
MSNVATIDEYWEVEKEPEKTIKDIDLKYAKVVQLTEIGRLKIIFDGESISSRKEFIYSSGYAPEAGDRVLVINGIVIGGWKP